MPEVVNRSSEVVRDRQAFLDAANCIDWSKSYHCIRCGSDFKLTRYDDAERSLSVVWCAWGSDSDIPDYSVHMVVNCPVCGQKKTIVGERFGCGVWLSDMKRQAKKRQEPPKKSFWRRIFG